MCRYRLQLTSICIGRFLRNLMLLMSCIKRIKGLKKSMSFILLKKQFIYIILFVVKKIFLDSEKKNNLIPIKKVY
jgi:hypothetical protein